MGNVFRMSLSLRALPSAVCVARMRMPVHPSHSSARVHWSVQSYGLNCCPSACPLPLHVPQVLLPLTEVPAADADAGVEASGAATAPPQCCFEVSGRRSLSYLLTAEPLLVSHLPHVLSPSLAVWAPPAVRRRTRGIAISSLHCIRQHCVCTFHSPTHPHLSSPSVLPCSSSCLPACLSVCPLASSLASPYPLSPIPPCFLACLYVHMAGEPASAWISHCHCVPPLPPLPSHHLRCVHMAETAPCMAGLVWFL